MLSALVLSPAAAASSLWDFLIWNDDVWAAETALDSDGDGVPDTADNCVDASNPAQQDLDGDGQGDGCDLDVDGDGLNAAAEAAAGTDPRNPDSDSDGVPDGADPRPLLNDGAISPIWMLLLDDA